MKTRNSLAFLLHARDYSETSVIASFLTKDFGILNALLKGAKRKGSKFANILSPGSEQQPTILSLLIEIIYGESR